MTAKLAFKHIPNKGFFSNLISKVIKYKTKSPYFHVELVLDDVWISAAPGEKVHINKLQELDKKYAYVDVKIDGRRLKKVKKFAQEQEGKDYDMLGLIFSQALHKDINNNNKWFCSELVSELLKVAGYDKLLVRGSNLYSPADLYNIFQK